MGWNVGLAVIEGCSVEEARALILGDAAPDEPEAELDLDAATLSDWRDDFVGFGVLGERVLVTNTFLWERESTWTSLSRSGRVFVFFLSENWGGSNVYDLYERGTLVRSYREDDGHGKPLFGGKAHPLEPPFKARMHPADRIGKIFEAMTGQALFLVSTLAAPISLYPRP